MPSNVLARTPPPADHRIAYGLGKDQFGDLRVPLIDAGELAPVVVFVHGGWWEAVYGLGYGGHLCAALKNDGVATWSLEYRRVGEAGGGWPGTFADVAAGYDSLSTLARSYPLDLKRVVVMGHSAGGHLAFWLAGRGHIPAESVLHNPQSAVPMRAVIALAGVVDLRVAMDLSGWFAFAGNKAHVLALMGASPKAAPERYRAGNPGELLPLNVTQVLVHGTGDEQVPLELARRWVKRGQGIGEHVSLELIADADHFDLVDPTSGAWSRVRALVMAALR